MMSSVVLLSFSVLFASAVLRTIPDPPQGEHPVKYSPSRRVSNYSQAAKSAILKHAVRSNVIITPSFPIKFKGVNYFWYGNYMYDARHPQKCEYVFGEQDFEFANVTFADGSKPPSLQFGCLSFQDCCGMQCCGDSRNKTLFILGGFVSFVFVYWLLRKCARSRAKRSLISMTDTTRVAPLGRRRFETHSV